MPAHQRRAAWPWALWLTLALCLAGTLGQLHRIAHAPGLVGAPGRVHGHAGDQVRTHGLTHGLTHVHTHVRAHEAAPAPRLATAILDGWTALFGLHDEIECRLYDQLSADPGLPTVAQLPLPPQLPAATLRREAGEFVARWAAMFDARGPPARFALNAFTA